MIDIAKKNWFVYLLECGDHSLYCGVTNNLDKRLKQHRGEIQGGAKYTRSRKPLKLAYHEIFETRSLAQKREIVIKKMTRSAKLELISASFNSEGDLNR